MTKSFQEIPIWPSNIAPMPVKSPGATISSNGGPTTRPLMPYACKTCSSRKVKCDKISPKCSSCEKSAVTCEYEAPQPRKKRKLREVDPEVMAKLAEYERILGENGLLPGRSGGSRSIEAPPSKDLPTEHSVDVAHMRHVEPETTSSGKLLAGRNGESQYVSSRMWQSLGDDEALQEDDDDRQVEEGTGLVHDGDPLVAAFMDSHRDLLEYHPTHEDALFLWRTHVDRVEPLAKILHAPSILPVIEAASQQPAKVSKSNECLMFAIYHFAVLSLTDGECMQKLPHSRTSLLQTYNFATRQALVNASFLNTTDLSILQALTLFLLSMKQTYDPRTFWILTGTAVRIAQRIGIHRDGKDLGLPPFETQIRRRLFYQILPLDMWAGQMAGTGIAVMPESWDSEAPWNLNDSQIWPGMTERPEEVKGATEMIFCLARACLGRAFGRAKMTNGWTGTSQPGVEDIITAAQSEVEETYLRYCDIVDPLHFLTICSARSGINAMRLRLRMAKVEKQSISEEGRREMLELTQKIVDTDTAACAQPALQKYRWYIGGLFVWGSWESLIFNLTTLRSGSLSTSEREAAWARVEQLFKNHPTEMLESRRALHVAIRRLTLKAWDINPAGPKEPDFVGILRSLRQSALQSRMNRSSNAGPTPDWTNTPSTVSAENSSTSYSDGQEFNPADKNLAFDLNFDIDSVDWSFWNQLIQDSQTAG